MEHVKQHFENEAQEFDGIIRRLIPYYEQMLEAIVTAIPFSPSQVIRVVDLGCGTGTIAKRIKDAYPHAQITCVDIAEKMLQIAQTKLGQGEDIRYQLANFEEYEFDSVYDVAVSSLALHHLVNDSDKIKFYKQIYASLAPGGLFYNADVVLASNSHLQERYMEQWQEYMLRQVPLEEIEQKWMPQHYNEDRPSRLMSQLEWLQEMGFVDIDVIWKYYNFAVYGGYKPSIE
ncbi:MULTISPECIES: class I SAM-dependent methyltransferase [unclassified Roseofilum]|uniref:class I SAM-dependent methyltransferase n=1 Tax=unclassified Roseofilum TaxID=2620099 RepID=UPI000E9139E9|nr:MULTISPECIES: class I SAM-dependent methyltransferase [unclassified Roseofilum]MBP0007766.1 class I SAM-dependent methyltransferase [Roseofilum sp. Belize Diploria]MBP0032159.1 class I SAM-dependent methyltransferase [Roseofilum sp. Belize BBD 4]HBR00832.1 methyltransferase type 12 [Cyanobacteria bacterium UBA11691]